MSTGRFIPLRVKLLGAMVPLIALPLGMAGAMLYAQYNWGLRSAAATSAEQVVSQVAGGVERLVADAERLTLAPISDSEVASILSARADVGATNTGFLSFEEEQATNRFLTSAVFDRRAITGYTIFTNDGRLLSAPASTLLVHSSWSQVSNAAWMDVVREAGGSLVALPAHEVSYYLGGSQTVVSFARLLRERVTHRPIGFAKVDLTEQALGEYLAAPTLGELGNIVVSTRDGERLYPVGDAAPLSGEILTVDADPLVMGMSVRADLTPDALRRDAGELVAIAIAIGIACIGIAALLAALVVRRMLAPVQRLTEAMNQVGGGELRHRVAVASSDEVGKLTVAFNSMMDDIDRLIDEVYLTQIGERDALIAALQGQMNPHFLYNSLETVNMLAVAEGQWGISEAVSSLGRQLRYLTAMERPLVALREEISFTDSWLTLQSLRRRHPIRFDDRIDPALDTVLVPRLSLQPVVENSVRHASDDRPLTITLSGTVDDGLLQLSVSDDGTGIPSAEAAAINLHLSASGDGAGHERYTAAGGEGGYGLANLTRRLRLHFGERAGLRVEAQDRGVAVAFTIPLTELADAP